MVGLIEMASNKHDNQTMCDTICGEVVKECNVAQSGHKEPVEGKFEENTRSTKSENSEGARKDKCLCLASMNDTSVKTGEMSVTDVDDSGILSDIKTENSKESNCDIAGGFEMVHGSSEIVHFDDFYESVYEMSSKRGANADDMNEENEETTQALNENGSSLYSYNDVPNQTETVFTGNSQSHFLCLPVELVIKILSYLTPREICKYCTPVCQKWKEIALYSCLWRSIDFCHNPNISSLDLLWVLRRAPQLRRLSLRGRDVVTHAEISILTEYCPMLQEIDLGFCFKLNNEIIECLVDTCPDLCVLNVEGCSNITTECVISLARCKKLHTINFSHCQIHNESVIHLAKQLPKIFDINLDEVTLMEDSGVIELAKYHSAHLVSVSLDRAEISDEGVRHLSRCKQLKYLELNFCDMLSDQTLVYLKDLEHLECLMLRGCTSSFTTAGLLDFFKTAKLQGLTHLNVSECICVNDDVVLQMVKCCGSSLRELALQWCYAVSDLGLVAIVDHCSNLRSLDLTGLHRIEGHCLFRLPEEIPHLTFLNLQQCDTIDDWLIQEVVREKPDLKVQNYYGELFVAGADVV